MCTRMYTVRPTRYSVLHYFSKKNTEIDKESKSNYPSWDLTSLYNLATDWLSYKNRQIHFSLSQNSPSSCNTFFQESLLSRGKIYLASVSSALLERARIKSKSLLLLLLVLGAFQWVWNINNAFSATLAFSRLVCRPNDLRLEAAREKKLASHFTFFLSLYCSQFSALLANPGCNNAKPRAMHLWESGWRLYIFRSI